LEVKKDGVPVLARKQPFLSLRSRHHQRVLSATYGVYQIGEVKVHSVMGIVPPAIW
jgi:hypothetical protein